MGIVWERAGQPCVMNKTIDPPRSPAGPISMIDSAEALALLRVSGRDLVDAVNCGRLDAFDLGGHLRFRRGDVLALARDPDGSEEH